MTFSGFFHTLCLINRVTRVSRYKETYNQLKEKIAEFGTKEVEELDLPWALGRSIKATRVMIIMEMLYTKGLEGDKVAANQFLDRTLGRPKESLNLTDESGIFGKLTDDELTKKIRSVIKAAPKGGAGAAD